MSDIFKTKEVRYVDDCRMLNYAECMGLITNGIIFKKFNIINKYDFDYLFLDEFFGGQIKYYVMRCIPETKEILSIFILSQPLLYLLKVLTNLKNIIKIRSLVEYILPICHIFQKNTKSINGSIYVIALKISLN